MDTRINKKRLYSEVSKKLIGIGKLFRATGNNIIHRAIYRASLCRMRLCDTHTFDCSKYLFKMREYRLIFNINGELCHENYVIDLCKVIRID